MSAVITLSDARARGVALPAGDTVAQDIIDEQEAWLTRRIGLLTGARTETFYVGLGETQGKLSLSRYTDAVEVSDNGVALDAARVTLIDRGSAVLLSRSELSPWWQGPFVEVTYSPNDEDEVRRALYDLCALAVSLATPHTSEQIGSYSYSGGGFGATAATRAQIASSLLPKRDPATSVVARPGRVSADDPVINRAEPR